VKYDSLPAEQAQELHDQLFPKIEQRTFEQLNDVIHQTSNSELLLGPIADEVTAGDLGDAQKNILRKQIAKKTGATLASIEKDARNRWADFNCSFSHLEVVKKVLQQIGVENLIFTGAIFFRWRGDVWAQIDDREIKKAVHENTDQKLITSNLVNSVIEILKTETFRIGFEFDQSACFINCKNGELYFEKNEWSHRIHCRENYRTSMIAANWDRDAQSPLFDNFLRDAFKGDPDAIEKIMIVHEAIGYSLTTSSRYEKFLMLIGKGANGKSVLLSVLVALIGREYVCAVQPDQFDNRFQRAHLVGKLANIVTEIKEGGKIADAQLKSLVSGELTTAEYKNQSPFDFHPFATMWFGTNHLPYTRDFSEALFRRAIILTFNNQFNGAARDVDLTEKLKQELPGILNHALAGLARLYANGCFTDCSSSQDIAAKWRQEADQAAQFVEECCEIDSSVSVSSQDIYANYMGWCDEVGIRLKLSRNTLTSRLESLGYTRLKGTNGVRLIHGLRLNGESRPSSVSKFPNLTAIRSG